MGELVIIYTSHSKQRHSNDVSGLYLINIISVQLYLSVQ